MRARPAGPLGELATLVPPRVHVTGRLSSVSGVFERFSEEARQAVVLAQEESERLGHRDLAVEHLLIGVARVAPLLLIDTADELRGAVKRQRPAEADAPDGMIPFAGPAQAALALADEDAGYRRHEQVIPAHVVI